MEAPHRKRDYMVAIIFRNQLGDNQASLAPLLRLGWEQLDKALAATLLLLAPGGYDQTLDSNHTCVSCASTCGAPCQNFQDAASSLCLATARRPLATWLQYKSRTYRQLQGGFQPRYQGSTAGKVGDREHVADAHFL